MTNMTLALAVIQSFARSGYNLRLPAIQTVLRELPEEHKLKRIDFLESLIRHDTQHDEADPIVVVYSMVCLSEHTPNNPLFITYFPTHVVEEDSDWLIGTLAMYSELSATEIRAFLDRWKSDSVADSFERAKNFHLEQIEKLNQLEKQYQQLSKQHPKLDLRQVFDVRLVESYQTLVENNPDWSWVDHFEDQLVTCWFPTVEQFKQQHLKGEQV